MNMLSYLEKAVDLTLFTTVITILVFILTVLYFILKDKKLPPGPIGLPLIGYWPFLKEDILHIQLHGFRKKYGDVCSLRIGGKLFIVLGSIKSIKEAHITKADSFARRYTDYSALSIGFGTGIVTRNGEEWKVMRKFFIQAFKEYGITTVKDYMSGPIYDSVNAAVASLKETEGSTVDILPIFNRRCLEIFRRMVFNDNEVTEKEIQDILDAYSKFMLLLTGKKLFLIGEFARKFLFPRLDHFEESVKSVTLMEKHLRKIIKRHVDTFDENNIRDIIDSYIKERKDRENKGDPAAKYFTDDSLIGSLIEFVGDGITSVAFFVAYFIRKLSQYPNEQEKIYEELMEVVGNDRQITVGDKNSLPYTNAFLMEVIRKADFVSYFTSLECTKETTLNGYTIPVGAITVLNFWSAHHDSSIFDDPEAFNPSRYLPEIGKPQAEQPVLFGVGKRSCAGESFTMMQIFLFVTTIKNFRIESPDKEVKKDFMDTTLSVRVHSRQ